MRHTIEGLIKPDTRKILRLPPLEARLIDLSQTKVLPLIPDTPPTTPIDDTRPVIELDPTKAILVDPSKFRVVLKQKKL